MSGRAYDPSSRHVADRNVQPELWNQSVELPYLDHYQHYYQNSKPTTMDERRDNGYAQCRYNPCHIVMGCDLKKHHGRCPDRDIDNSFHQQYKQD